MTTTTPPDARNALAELMPCPFCGGKPNDELEDNGSNVTWVICDNVKDGCGCEGPYKHTPEDAIEAWNRRASEARIAALEAQVEGMRVALERILDGKVIADKRYPGSTVVIDLPLDEIEEICRAALQSSETTGEK